MRLSVNSRKTPHRIKHKDLLLGCGPLGKQRKGTSHFNPRFNCDSASSRAVLLSHTSSNPEILPFTIKNDRISRTSSPLIVRKQGTDMRFDPCTIHPATFEYNGCLQVGEVPEWLIGAVSKTVVVSDHRGFESHPLR